MIAEEPHDPLEPLLLDTHALIWLMDGDRRLGSIARTAIFQAGASHRSWISAITPWEIGLLVQKKRIELNRDTMAWIAEALSLPGIRLAPLSPEIAVASTCLPFEMHPDPADRILVATARHLGARLVTADRNLLALSRRRYLRTLNAER